MRPPLAILFLADWLLASAVRHAPASPVAHTVEVPALLEEGNVFHYGHQVLKKLHSETDASQGDEFISYLAKTTMEKCAELKVAQNASNATEQLKRTLKEVCQETDSSHVVSEIFSLMNDALVAKWICGGLTAVDYMSANELEQCQDAGKVVLGGLTGMMEAKGKGKMLATMQTYALKLAVIFVPLPPPLGVIIEKGANLALSSLANDATSHLENLETKMSAMMRKSLSQELLRLGTAQARAADEQIQEMITLDALLNDMVSKSSKLFGGDFAAAMARVTSFNRWAIIEHDLSTSTEVLRPPDEMQRLEERAHFARLMETHLEMYILVLSQMHRSLGDRASLEIQASLTRKAQRMARLLLPDLILHSQSVSVSSASRQLQIFGSSPLLSSVGSRCSSTKPSPREALCCRLLGRPEFHLEFLVTCLWLPLMDPPNGDFAYPLRVDGFSTEQACFLAPDELPDLVQDGLASCANHQVLQSLHQEWTQRTFFSDQEQIHYMCGDPTERRITLLPFTFDTDGLCLERVRLFQNDVVAVLTSVHFESRLEHQLSEINRSTCRLAYRTSGVPYGGLKQWDLRSTLPTLRRHNGSVCDHCHWASPYSCAFQPRKPQPKPHAICLDPMLCPWRTGPLTS